MRIRLHTIDTRRCYVSCSVRVKAKPNNRCLRRVSRTIHRVVWCNMREQQQVASVVAAARLEPLKSSGASIQARFG